MPGSIDNIVTGYLGFGCIKFAGYSLASYWMGQWYLDPKPLRCVLNQDGKTINDGYCQHCEYNLRSISSHGKCPECGNTIEISRLAKSPDTMNHAVWNILIVGLTRTLIGMAFGTAYWWLFGPNIGSAKHLPLLLLGLVPIRITEWWIVVWLFFDRRGEHISTDWRAVGFGTLCSYLLDIPALLGFCVTGGVSIC
jgi:hypothetical protein